MKRFPIEGRTICNAVVCDGYAYIVATDPDCADGIAAQTRGALGQLDRLLMKAGSSKAGLIQATVYLSDISSKTEMDVEWSKWIGPQENWPQRACVGVALEEGYLIEIVVMSKVL